MQIGFKGISHRYSGRYDSPIARINIKELEKPHTYKGADRLPGQIFPGDVVDMGNKNQVVVLANDIRDKKLLVTKLSTDPYMIDASALEGKTAKYAVDTYRGTNERWDNDTAPNKRQFLSTKGDFVWQGEPSTLVRDSKVWASSIF